VSKASYGASHDTLLETILRNRHAIP
jgi:hypothetical protein